MCGVFRLAAYLRFGDRILALCGPGVEPGPLHLRLDRLPPLAVGQVARRTAGRLVVDMVTPAGPERLSVDLGRAPRWEPPVVDAAALRRAAASRTPGPRPHDLAAVAGLPGALVDAAADELAGTGDLVALARLVGGLGPGLTPAGDDLLAGVLVADAALHPQAGAARHDAAVTAAARTNDVAAAFLRWAAAGQCIRPVHDVLLAVAAGDSGGEVAARHRVGRIGASSGAALLLGLDLALAAGASRPAA